MTPSCRSGSLSHRMAPGLGINKGGAHLGPHARSFPLGWPRRQHAHFSLGLGESLFASACSACNFAPRFHTRPGRRVDGRISKAVCESNALPTERNGLGDASTRSGSNQECWKQQHGFVAVGERWSSQCPHPRRDNFLLSRNATKRIQVCARSNAPGLIVRCRPWPQRRWSLCRSLRAGQSMTFGFTEA